MQNREERVRQINSTIDLRLRELEQNSDCWDWKVEGLDVWPLFKTSIATKALELSLPKDIHGRIRQKIWRTTIPYHFTVRHFTPSRLAQPAHLSKAGPEGEVLFYGSRQSSSLIGGRWIMHPYHALMLSAGMEQRPVRQWLEDCDEDANAVRNNWLEATHGVAAWLADARKPTTMLGRLQLPPECAPAVKVCADLFGVSEWVAGAWLCELTSSCIRLRDHFVTHFTKSKPEFIVLCSGGYWSTAALTAAARICKIPSIEVQHGLLREGLDHPFLLHPSRPNTLADCFVTTTQIRDRGAGSSTYDHERLVKGQWGTLALLHEKWLPKDLAKALNAETTQRDLLMEKLPDTFHVLVTHQHFDDLTWLVELAQRADPRTQFWLRFRDGRLPDNCDSRIATLPNCEWEFSSQCSLAHLMAVMDLHITQYSASALEAADMGLKTLALHKFSSAIYGDHAPLAIKSVDVGEAESIIRQREMRDHSLPALDETIWQRVQNACAAM